MSLRRLRQLKRDRDGSILVEMALLTPFLLVIGLGVIEFGRFFQQYQLVQAGVRDAARYLARVTHTPSSSGSSPCAVAADCLVPCNSLVLAEKAGNARQIAVTGRIGGSTKRVSWWNTGDVTIDYSTIIPNPLDSTGYPTYRGPTGNGADGPDGVPHGIRVIRVTTTPSYPGVGFLSYLNLGSSITFTVEHQERCIGEG